MNTDIYTVSIGSPCNGCAWYSDCVLKNTSEYKKPSNKPKGSTNAELAIKLKTTKRQIAKFRKEGTLEEHLSRAACSLL